MLRRLLPIVVVALAAAPVALADGGSAPVAADGVVAPGGKIRYTTVGGGDWTTVEAVRVYDGGLVRAATLHGQWVVPGITIDGVGGGLSHDGRMLVLARLQTTPVPTRSVFELVRTSDLRPLRRVVLKGNFAFDALSPDASRLYLIEHVSNQDLSSYVVRAYDLARRRLLPGRIADRTQRGWVMAGYPVTRVTSADGRWIYTFYVRSGAYSFVHALDATRGVAHCIGIPWNGAQNILWQLRLSLRDGGRTLRVSRPSGREYLSIATGTWRISHPGAAAAARSGSGSGFPWWVLGVAGAGLLLLLGLRRLGYGLRARAATN
jgi:hypothetical protein